MNISSPHQGYNYKKPRKLNLVSVLLLGVVVAVAYGAWKFGPVYYTRYKVDEALSNAKNTAATIGRLNAQSQEALRERVLGTLYGECEELGITYEENDLDIDFDDDLENIIATYNVVVKHPGGKRTKLNFRLKQSLN